MRMWGVPVQKLCQKHLGGEHVEMHMFIGTILRGNSINGYIDKGLVEVSKIIQRHDELASELIRRGGHHQSPIDHKLSEFLWEEGHVDVQRNIEELSRRCEKCRANFLQT